MQLSLFNTLTKTIEEFNPIDKNCVKIYVCGPTVYDHPHIGNARSTVVYDLLFRLLRLIYGASNVKYVRNITDIDDKIINRAQEMGITISELTSQTIKHFQDDMEYLNCFTPTHQPKATEHIQDMIDIISLLIKNGKAYESSGHVYFNVAECHDYTRLSSRDQDSIISSGRVDHSPGKISPEDFVLWKPAAEDDISGANFDSPFGFGRPGWHIECSAMSKAYLGKDFDLHGGGADLIFPHHTNEIAQSCSAFPGSCYAKYWVHNGFLTVDGQKMSKSLGNFLTVYDLRKNNVNPDAVRLLLLSTHYRKPLDFSKKAIDDSTKLINYFHNTISKSGVDTDTLKASAATIHATFLEQLAYCEQRQGGYDEGVYRAEICKIHGLAENLTPPRQRQLRSGDGFDSKSHVTDVVNLVAHSSYLDEFFDALAHDMNISLGIRVINDLAKSINSDHHLNILPKVKILYFCLEFLGIVSTLDQVNDKGQALPNGVYLEWIEEMIKKRELAKSDKNWQEADLIRTTLKAKGISLNDRKDGTTSWSVI